MALAAKSKTKADCLADALREEIRNGELSPGADLTQEALALRFGVSRIPLREALRKLDGEGLVEIDANRGAVVSALSAADVREIYELRMLIETDLLSRAIPLLTQNQLQRAESIHRMLQNEKDPKEQDSLNREFHETLYKAARRPRQLALVESLRNLVERYYNLNRSLMKKTSAFQNDHRKILTACRNRKTQEARTYLQKHLQHAMQVVLNGLEKELQ